MLRLPVTPESAADHDIEEAVGLLESHLAGPDRGGGLECQVVVSPEGFDETEIGLARRADLRRWFALLRDRFPFIVYCLNRDPEHRQLLLYCLMFVPFAVKDEHVTFRREELSAFVVQNARDVIAFAVERGLKCRLNLEEFGRFMRVEIPDGLFGELPAGEPHPEIPAGVFTFAAEPITSERIERLIGAGNCFHLFDQTDEPVAFALTTGNPDNLQECRIRLDLLLFHTDHYSVVDVRIRPQVAGVDETFHLLFNLDEPLDQQELAAYQRLKYLPVNVLFRYGPGNHLFYAFTRAVELPEEIRAEVPEVIRSASAGIRSIPAAWRSWSKAVEQLKEHGFRSDRSGRIDISVQRTSAGRRTERPTRESEIGADEAERKPPDQLDLPFDHGLDEEPEAWDGRRGGEGGPHRLPDRLDRVSRSLTGPSRDRLAGDRAWPEGRNVSLREEDQVEKISRRLVILENKLDSLERENQKLSNENRILVGELKRHERERLLERRWWRFWGKGEGE